MDGQSLTKVVVAFCAPNPKDTHFTGVAVGYHDHPTMLIDCGDGHPACWAAHLCRDATPDEAIAYWRERALKAEQQGNTP